MYDEAGTAATSHIENISKMFPFMFETKFLISSYDYCITRRHTEWLWSVLFSFSLSFLRRYYLCFRIVVSTDIYSTEPGTSIVMHIKSIQCLLNESSTDLWFPDFMISLIPRALFMRFCILSSFFFAVHLFIDCNNFMSVFLVGSLKDNRMRLCCNKTSYFWNLIFLWCEKNIVYSYSYGVQAGNQSTIKT